MNLISGLQQNFKRISRRYLNEVNLGYGSRYIKGYVYINVVSYQHIDHVAQIDQLPFRG